MTTGTTLNTSMPRNIDFLCPVCGFEMDIPPVDYNICPSCGTEFGVNDVNSTIAELREVWLEGGPAWWNTTESVPINWNPKKQLSRLALIEHTRRTGARTRSS